MIENGTTESREDLVLQAVVNAVNKRLNESLPRVRDITIRGQDLPSPIINEVRTPEVHVVNELTSSPAEVVVQVDMGPVAAALDRMTAAQSQAAELFSRLLTILSEQAPPIIRVRPARVNVAAPNVTVEAPELPQPVAKKSRTLHIRHDDGSESTITEE